MHVVHDFTDAGLDAGGLVLDDDLAVGGSVEQSLHVALDFVVRWLVGWLAAGAAEEGAERVEQRLCAGDAVAGLFAQGLVDASPTSPTPLATLERASR